MKSITIFLLCALLEYTASHYARITKSNITCADVGEYQMMSYHIHCLYDVDNAQQVETSNKLRREFEHQFFPEGIPDCTPEMESLLLVYDTQGPANESMKACNLGTMPPGAPFYQTNWAYFVNLESIGYMIPWLMQFINKNDTIYIHPNSGCMERDHVTSAMWMGVPLTLNTNDGWCNIVGCNGVWSDKPPFVCYNQTHGTCYQQPNPPYWTKVSNKSY
eukprot:465748_1